MDIALDVEIRRGQTQSAGLVGIGAARSMPDEIVLSARSPGSVNVGFALLVYDGYSSNGTFVHLGGGGTAIDGTRTWELPTDAFRESFRVAHGDVIVLAASCIASTIPVEPPQSEWRSLRLEKDTIETSRVQLGTVQHRRLVEKACAAS